MTAFGRAPLARIALMVRLGRFNNIRVKGAVKVRPTPAAGRGADPAKKAAMPSVVCR
jgi:hypothetical protein